MGCVEDEDSPVGLRFRPPGFPAVLDQWVFALHQWVFVLDQWVFASDQLVFVLDQWVFLLDYWVSSLRFRHIQTQDGLIYTRIKDTESMFSVL